MSSSPWRLAARFTGARTAGNRWRRWSIVFSVIVATMLAMTAAGILAAAHHADQKKTARMPEWSTSADDAAFYGYNSIMKIDGVQFTVLWVEPGPEFSEAVIPPGLSRFPRGGEAAVSPGLAAIGVTAGELGFDAAATTSGAAGVIGDEGVESPDEYFAYVRAPEGSGLGDPDQLLYFAGFSEDQVTNSSESWFSPDPPVPPVLQLAPYVVIMLLAPAILLVVTAMRMHSSHREDRLRILRELGISPRAVTALQMREGLLAALPAAVVGVLLTQVAAVATGHLPWAPAQVFRGDLRAPWWAIMLWLLFCTGAVLGGVALDALRSRKLRNGQERERASVLWFVLLAAVVIAMAMIQSPMGDGMDPGERGNVFLATALATVLLLPPSLPWMVRQFARRLSLARWPAASIAVARARHAPLTIARGGAMLALMIFLGTFALSLIASRQATAEESGAEALASVFWMQEDAEAVDAVGVAIDQLGGSAYPLGVDTDGNSVVIIESCEETVVVMLGLTGQQCEAALDPGRGESAREELLAAGYANPIPVRTAAARTTSALLVVPAEVTAVQVFSSLAPGAAGLSVAGLGSSQVHYYLLRWYTYFLLIGVGALWLALCRDMADRALRGIEERQVLFRIGLPESLAWRIIKGELAIPSFLAFILGTVLGVAAGGVGQQIGVTLLRLRDVLLVSGIGAGSALLAAMLVVLCLRRSARGSATTASTPPGACAPPPSSSRP